MKTVGIVRDRGQLTIPEAIRKVARWINTSSVVSISSLKPDEIIITPHHLAREIKWDRLFEFIEESRDIKSRANISASEFIIRERGLIER